MSISENAPFRVVIEPFAESHYVKSFQKKYKSSWDVTRKAIVAQLNNVDVLVHTGRLHGPIHESIDKNYAIYKLYFAVAGRKESPKSSGNRVILLVDYSLRTVKILLVYSKNEIGPPNETVEWERLVSQHYSEISLILSHE